MDNATFRPLDGHVPAQPGATPRPGIFERDDLFLTERIRELRAASTAIRPRRHSADDALVGRARRTVGAALIAIGTAVAGARIGVASDAPPSDERGVGAAA
jgi:hypothetical protein